MRLDLRKVLKMKWEKPSAKIISIFEKIVPAITGVENRKMFGLPCVFINSNMFMGVYPDNIFLRLSKSDREEFLKLEGTKVFEPQPGRVMKEYAVFPEWMFKEENADTMNDWIYKSFEYTAALPAKEKKKK
jgi:TfoX/Sxy family transcriptional regulator of competence genes